MRVQVVSLLVVGSLVVGGCVAGLASSAIGMAVRGAQGEPQGNQHLQPAAEQACREHAAQHGAVQIIDVQQSSVSKIIVWGTVGTGNQRQSFECSYGKSITGFKLRPIKLQ